MSNKKWMDVNGHRVQAVVLEEDETGRPTRLNIEGAELVPRGDDEHREWLMVLPSSTWSPLKAARELLRADYETDVKSIADDAKGDIRRGIITNPEELERFVTESCDGSSRMLNTASQREILVYTSSDIEEDSVHMDLPYAAFCAFRDDVYAELGDIDSLFAPDGDDDDETPEDT